MFLIFLTIVPILGMIQKNINLYLELQDTPKDKLIIGVLFTFHRIIQFILQFNLFVFGIIYLYLNLTFL
jgi:hypothetical protein